MGNLMRGLTVAGLLAVAVAVTPAAATDYLRDQGEVETLLEGKTLRGTYLRTDSPYSLEFKADGTLVNQVGNKGKWWVNETGQYCREWITGKLQGNKACLDLAPSGEGIGIYYQGRKVAEGSLAGG